MPQQTWSLGAKEPRMLLRFHVPYFTQWGQRVVLTGSGALLGNWDIRKGVSMTCGHQGSLLIWHADVVLPPQPTIDYTYHVVNEADEIQSSALYRYSVPLSQGLKGGDVIEFMDVWEDQSYEGSIYGTAFFTDVVNADKHHTAAPCSHAAPPSLDDGETIVRFSVRDWMLKDGQTVCIVGSIPQLGMWQERIESLFAMTEVDTPLWQAEIKVPLSLFPFSYKYVIVEADSVLMESGESRIAMLPESAARPPSMVVHNDGHVRRELWRGSGIAVPVFSLRTRDSVGCGDFYDIMKLVDFAACTGFRLVQILPVNDTTVHKTWVDSYPYSAVSVYALHPLYLRLQTIADDMPSHIMAEIKEAQEQLNGVDVMYPETMAVKLKVARAMFNIEGKSVMQGGEFKTWFAANKHWLQHYAAFSFLRDLFNTAEHWRWGELSTPTDEVLERILSPQQEWHQTILFHYYLQWKLHCQLLAVSQYAASQRVALKGDLPIGVAKSSVDTWLCPHLFRLNTGTGSPPDFFDANGQNWGFPTYNWEEMAKDGYQWWRSRLSHMAQYFHAYRIDHILGFFRIWEIPGDAVSGVMGYFRPCLPIQRHELEARGLWDVERLCTPYIRSHMLKEYFGDHVDDVLCKYLVEYERGKYRFRPQWSSEASLKNIKPRPNSPDWLVEETKAIQRGLILLRRNVLLLPNAEDEDSFFPRFDLRSTSSYAELDDEHAKAALAELHDDYFYRRQNDMWAANALRTLPVLMGATRMLVCGEDLGFVPACVGPVLHRLGLIGLRIQRMPSEENEEFGHPERYPYLSVASPSCHDTTTTRAWWEEDAERRDRFFYKALRGGGTPPSTCTPDIMQHIVQQHLNCPSVLAIFPIQDLMALSGVYTSRPAKEETINDPTKNPHYWRYRIHVTIEDMLADTHLVALLQSMNIAAKRAVPHELPQIYLANNLPTDHEF